MRHCLVARAVQPRISGAGESCQIIERYVGGSHRAAQIGVIVTRVRIPELPGIHRTPASGVEGAALVSAKLAEIADALSHARHTGVRRCTAHCPGSLVIEKEESLVSLDRPADSTSEVVPAQAGQRRTAGIGEKVVGVQFLIAQELVE